MSKFWNIVFLIGLVGVSFLYRERIQNVWVQSINHYFPCKTTITYKIGTFDARFGISKTDFLTALEEAEAIWEKPVGREFFSYSPDGNMKVNLIFDERQEVTVTLKDLGIIVQNNKASYDSLKSRYDLLVLEYERQKSVFDSRLSAFEVRRKAYEAEVSSLNRKGGASGGDYARLNAERDYLNSESAALNKMQENLSTAVSSINTVVRALNELAATLNLGVKKYNTVGGSLGGEFDEGLYKTGPGGQEIDIYQFEDRTKLIRVLAHELGHALGLPHVEDPKAIMYRLNNGINEKLTETDLAELKALCGIE